jgi:predicted DNA-binding transcriptional regulator AlpA
MQRLITFAQLSPIIGVSIANIHARHARRAMWHDFPRPVKTIGSTLYFNRVDVFDYLNNLENGVELKFAPRVYETFGLKFWRVIRNRGYGINEIRGVA